GAPRRSIADPRVEERVGEINRQIDEHVGEREQQDDGLDGGIVAGQHRVDREPAQSGIVYTDSVTTTPPISSAIPRPMTVTIGTAALASAWRTSTLISVCPLARAVRM